MELDEETVILLYENLTRNLSKESRSFLKTEYADDSDMMECLGKALFNESVVELLTNYIQ